MSKHFAIQCTDVAKKYSKSQKHGDLRSTLSALFGKKEAHSDFWALKDINFTIEQGETVGIIGRNGAGKSTLLKLLSKITYPTNGNIKINGRLTSLLEVGTGFHPQLTGRENIFLNGSLLGMTRDEIKNRLEEIIEFSGVSEFIDMPVKHYSSGMYVRLAFSVAAHLRTDILLVDEVLAVGDAFFQKKSLTKMNEVVSEGRTVLLVSHNLEHINALCHKAIVLENGKMGYFGKCKQAIAHYSNSFKNTNFESNPNYLLKVNNVEIQNVIHSISGSEMILSFTFLKHLPSVDLIRVIILNHLGHELTIIKSNLSIEITNSCLKGTKIKCEVPKLPLNEGTYAITVELKSKNSCLYRYNYKLYVGFGKFYKTNAKVHTKYNFLIDHNWILH